MSAFPNAQQYPPASGLYGSVPYLTTDSSAVEFASWQHSQLLDTDREWLPDSVRRTARRVRRAVRFWIEDWLEADYSSRQLPLLMLSLAFWAGTAWIALSSTAVVSSHVYPVSRSGTRVVYTGPQKQPGSWSAPADVNVAQQQFIAALQQLTDSLSQAASERLLAFIIPEPTSPSQVAGNPNLRVRVNNRTGLYYCPVDRGFKRGTSLKWMTQKDAERYHFLPAGGAPCQ